jgi:Ca2+-binding RTX toxin-like protein
LANGGALPSWLRFDATTRTFSGTPSGTDAGVPSRNLDIVVTATDRGGKTATDIFVLSVHGNRTVNGTSGKDNLVGNIANETIIAGAGDDTLSGGAGHDWLQGDAGNDLVFGNAGNDRLFGTLGNDTLDGGSGDDTLDGGAGNDALLGGEGADRLFGAAGNDSMRGGAGDDLYLVDVAGDVVIELPGEGFDTVISSLSITLAENLEGLTLASPASALFSPATAAIFATGNGANNRLIGDVFNNTLDGLAGADTMAGGSGNDTYVVDDTGDVIEELVNQGTTDTVRSSIDFMLGAELERLELTGSARNGTGNTGNNRITGNAQDNRLDGGTGNDTLDGGTGMDYLTGGDGNDSLIGGVGADSMSGGKGNDTLTGGVGADTFVFDALLGSTNVDRITDMVATGSVQDHFWLDDGIFTAFTGRTAIDPAMLRAGAGFTTAITVAHRLIYNSSTGDLYYDADGTGGTAAVKFAILAGVPLSALSADDFIVG